MPLGSVAPRCRQQTRIAASGRIGRLRPDPYCCKQPYWSGCVWGSRQFTKNRPRSRATPPSASGGSLHSACVPVRFSSSSASASVPVPAAPVTVAAAAAVAVAAAAVPSAAAAATATVGRLAVAAPIATCVGVMHCHHRCNLCCHCSSCYCRCHHSLAAACLADCVVASLGAAACSSLLYVSV